MSLQIISPEPSPPPRPTSPSPVLLCIDNQGDLEMWRAGTSNKEHIDRLEWNDIRSVEGFGEQLRALTEVKVAYFHHCDIFHSIEAVHPLTNLGSSLVQLTIYNAKTSPTAMEDLLAGLPKLCQLFVHGIHIKSDPDFVGNRPIPFFENSGEMCLFSMDYSEGTLGWIPQTPHFKGLSIGTLCAHQNPELVGRWIRSSCETLKDLELKYDPNINGMCLGQYNFQSSLLTL